MRRRNLRQPFANLVAAVGLHPLLHNHAHLIELRHFNQDRRHSRRAPRHQLQVAQRRQKRRAPSASILPALARLEAQRAQQAGKPLLRRRRSHLRHQRNPLIILRLYRLRGCRCSCRLFVAGCLLPQKRAPLESASNVLVCLKTCV